MTKRLGVLVLACSGCALHLETQRNAPGRLGSLDRRDGDLDAKALRDRGEDPGMRGWLGHLTLLAGGNIDSEGSGSAAGVELGAVPFELPKWTAPAAVFDAQQRTWVRPSVGFMFVDDSNVRLTRGRPGAGIGPLYAEIQFFPWQGKPFGEVRLGAGGLVELAYADGGAQATACVGLHVLVIELCLRGAALANRGPELGIYLASSGLATVAWSK